MGWVSDVSCVIGEVLPVGGVVRAVSIGHPSSLQVPATSEVPCGVGYDHNPARILVVSQHVTHGYRVVARRVGKGKHDVILA